MTRTPQTAKKTGSAPSAARDRDPGRLPPLPARRRHALAVLDALGTLYPEARCELDYGDPFQLLCAVILSAQCTDARVNTVTPALFARYPDAPALAAADPEAVMAIIRPTGFFRNKAAHLIGMAQRLCEEHGGQVPADLEALLRLPGVARKTANVILCTGFGIPSGIAVDTHVTRLAGRLGLSAEREPDRIEADLRALWPKERWILAGHQLIWHGRRVCEARRPRCGDCALYPLCPGRETAEAKGATP